MKLLLVFGLFVAAFIGMVNALLGPFVAGILVLLLVPPLFIVRDYRVGVVVALMLVPFSGTYLLGHLSTLSTPELLVAATLASFAFVWMLGRGEVVPLPKPMLVRYLLPLGIALAIGLTHLSELSPLTVLRVGAEFSSKGRYLMAYGVRPLLIVALAFLLANAVKESKRPERFLIPMAISLVLWSLVLLAFIAHSGLGLAVISSAHARSFLSPLGMHANEFGGFFGIGFVVFLFVLPAVKSPFARLMLLGVLGITLVALALTFSRGGYVLVAVAVVYFMVSQSRVKMAVWMVVFLMLAALAAPKEIQERATTGLGSGGDKVQRDVMSRKLSDDELTAGRVWLWRQTFPNFYKSPLIGSGLGSQAWSEVVRSGIVPTAQTHSFYLSMLYDTGLIGVFVMMSFFVYMYRSFKQVAQNKEVPPTIAAAMQGGAAALLGYGVMCFTNGLFWPRVENVMLWCLFGICIAYLPKPLSRRQAQAGAVLEPQG